MKLKSLVSFLFICLLTFNLNAQSVTVVAASDMKFALDSIISVFKKTNKDADVKAIYGSSGKLYEQIMNNAPFDLFFSADIGFPNKLKASNMAISDVRSYGIGRIVLWSKVVDPSKHKMNALFLPEIKKIAIANPAHAPYGARAKESFQKYGIFEKVESKLVFGENISQTAQFISSGAAEIGVIALSLAIAPNMKKEGGTYYLIPENMHTPLDQGYVLLKNAKGNALAKSLYDFIKTPQAIKILTYFGFKQK